jgi:hypothetical protein
MNDDSLIAMMPGILVLGAVLGFAFGWVFREIVGVRPR